MATGSRAVVVSRSESKLTGADLALEGRKTDRAITPKAHANWGGAAKCPRRSRLSKELTY